ncbi:hypothetical protein G7068_01385 [Leucobacter viscericola]|uniref:Uncharacterized protein n=1 Tax=Leucobacter viscericola TaxID=2714935 RepID=A0A6G7XC13_9MICO|nr:hypothetical protein [Leucobacter viscericola]QIK62006.1 hypothetical protein G7068_01385 [Leucobacter viscericola]
MENLAVAVDSCPLDYMVDDIIHNLVAGGEAPSLIGIDHSAAWYSPSFGEEMSLNTDDAVGMILAVINSRTLFRIVSGDSEFGITLLRSSFLQRLPVLLAVSDDQESQLNNADWAAVADFLAATDAKWLDLSDGSIRAAREAHPPALEFDEEATYLDPLYWAEPRRWASH